ncbi:M23 family metallopeptidase [Microbacterium rhizomatis]|uniref:M23 family metallopeptidase n=1 Tax=Microbacterium rhizomatis TaxID=1631477 RepID=UPI0014791030|nr:M23 family metallopeptidase [Microbacterium rhizomatis]
MTPLARDGYSATTLQEVTAIQSDRDRRWPLSGAVVIGDGIGARDGAHMGIDLPAAEGAPVRAAASGTIRVSREDHGGYGVAIIIDHEVPEPTGERTSTLYAHLSFGSRKFEEGQHVSADEVIALVGNTGRSYGAHLHFEVHINDRPSDPLAWLPDTIAARSVY